MLTLNNRPMLMVVVSLLSVSQTFGQCPQSCVTDYGQSDCPAGSYIQENQTVAGCCPGCAELVGVGGVCFARLCAPGLSCVNNLCVLDVTSCWHYQHLRPDPDKIEYPPTCLSDGTYAPVQCKGDGLTGRCFCSDDKGTRIFGHAWRSQQNEMTCACSRRRSELEASRSAVTLHCTPDGSYESLQCDDGLCWCADHRTGAILTHVVTEMMMQMLPCYSEMAVGAQYLRQCESRVVAQDRIYQQQLLHGTDLIVHRNTFCDYDGSYGNYQIDNGILFCSWKDGSRISSFQTSAGATILNMNCYCARDTMLYRQYGLDFELDCQGNGNYMAKQQAGGQHYCVDTDGFPTTRLADLGEDIDCPGF